MAERNRASIPVPRIEELAASRIAGIDRHYRGGDMSGIPAQWGELGAHGHVPGKKGDAHYGICCGLKGEGMHYLCGVEIAAGSKLPFPGWEEVTLPAGKYAVFEHQGSAAGLHQTIHAIWENWLPHSGLSFADEYGLFFEKYGPDFDAATGTGRIEIWIPVA